MKYVRHQVCYVYTLSLLASSGIVPNGHADDSSCVIVTSSGASLESAKVQFEQSCPELQRDDCDPVSGDRWMCSTDNIDENTAISPIAPGETTIPPFEPNLPAIPLPNPTTPSVESTLPTEQSPMLPANPVSGVVEHTYTKNDGPFKNPLKGWNSGWDGGNDYLESSVGFQYIPWKDFEPNDGTFDRAAVENIIDNEGSKNRHLILRLYCDWHGDDAESDCPSWMYKEAGVARLKGDNGRYITDFNDSRYIAQARDAIQAFAEEYDNDPRIYAVQMGVIGYWGEWHSWGSSFNGDSYDLKEETQVAILNAYRASFSNAKIMARYPWREPTQSAGGIGFHNDFFVTDNSHSEEFDNAVATGSQWIENPIGGEVPPRGNGEANIERNVLFDGQSGEEIIETGHYSTMKAGSYRVSAGQQGYSDYMRLHKKMGYNYQIDLARFPVTLNTSESLPVELIGTNIGVAPMYFNWDVQFALLGSDDQPAVVQDSDIRLTEILPDSMFSFSTDMSLNGLSKGVYRLAVRIIQPGADLPKQQGWKLDARNTYILFSNDMPVVNGSWDNNRLVGGWSVLGDIALQ